MTTVRAGTLRVGSLEMTWGLRTYVMAILNLTPDSFSGDGLEGAPQLALQRAREAESEGADILDIGGMSTRPGHIEVDAEEESRRVIPLLALIRSEISLPISIDTSDPLVARRALDAGADLINDVRALGAPGMRELVAERGVPAILMHNRSEPVYDDLVEEVVADLETAARTAETAGIPAGHLVIDPGFGFGKTSPQNLLLLRRLHELTRLERPILVGTSRKSTIGKVLRLPVEERLEGTAATVALAIAGGADIIRVHDVRAMVRVARMTDAVVRRTPDDLEN